MINKRGIAKFWIEIIGGVIIVVIVLLVFLMLSSAISTGVEDASNRQRFIDFTQLVAKAHREGEDTVAPFIMKTSETSRVYAITFITPSLADCLYQYSVKANPTDDDLVMCRHEGSNPVRPSFKLDRVSLMKLKKCTKTTLMEEGDPQDMCLCMIRADYKHRWGMSIFENCVPYYNVIGESLSKTGIKDPKSAYSAISTWVSDKLERDFVDSSKVENVKILECSLVKGDMGCYVNEGGTEYPCAIAIAPYDDVFRGLITDWFGGEDWFSSGAKPLLLYWFGGTGLKPVNLDVMTARSNDAGLIYLHPYDNKGVYLFVFNLGPSGIKVGTLAWSAKGSPPILDPLLGGCG
ncbi:MAG: hypothetical protein J7K73_03755 [Nanoarchaeota archaeon]|nr:hypothetical protein [Nanoarchaeota archaeon]